MTSSSPGFAPGTVVADRYRIESKLGEGGYGAVFAATQIALGRRVALKVLHPDVLTRRTALERFFREARLAQQMSHPNVVRLLDYGSAGETTPFIAFELLEGRSVERELASVGGMPAARVLHVAQQTLKGLMEAHSLGIVHRDIKPGNLFLSDFAGEPDFLKILDFGIATAPAESTSSGPLTQEGVSLGTPAYMAPEQVLARPVDGRADLYALGLVMCEMLTGRPVFGGKGALQIAMLQADTAPVPLPNEVVASPLGPIIARAVEKDPERRFRSAHEMLAALQNAKTLSGAPTAAVHDALNAFATGPTVGIATPMSGSRAVDPRPFAPTATPAPATPAPAKRSVAMLVLVVLAAFVCGAIGFGALLIRRERVIEAKTAYANRAKTKRVNAGRKIPRAGDGESNDTESADELLDHPERVLDGTHTGPCRPLVGLSARVSVRGIDVDTMLRRLDSAGYHCASRVDNDIAGARNAVFILQGHGTATMMVVMESGMNPMGSGADSKLVMDPSGASAAFGSPNGATVSEAVFGK